MNFNEFKTEILKRAKEANACNDQYRRAYLAETFEQLFAVIKENFNWCCNTKTIDGELLESIKEDANACDIWVIQNTTIRCLMAFGNMDGENSTVLAYENISSENYLKI